MKRKWRKPLKNEVEVSEEQTAFLPEPRGPRRRIELLHASVTELDIMNFSLLI